jgi:superfamily II DNA/RNA helicase
VKAIREHGGHVIIATPGRLDQLLGQGSVNVKSLDVLVLDEADRYEKSLFSQ